MPALLIASKDDDHLPLLVPHLRSKAVIIDPADICRGKSLTYSHTGEAVVVSYDKVELTGISGVWCRSPLTIDDGAIPAGIDPKYREYCRNALQRFIEMLADQFKDARWVSPYHAMRRASNKSLQLAVAGKVGLRVPATVITSDKTVAEQFVSNHQVAIIKSLTPQVTANGSGQRSVFFATKVHKGHKLDYAALPLAPLIFQEAINSTVDVRVVVVGRKLFAARITTDQNENSHIRDWRIAQFSGKVHIEPFVLPVAARQSCFKLLKQLGLVFGILDFVLDKEGTLWFLENNTTGAWGFIENATKQPISKAVADVLS